MEGIVKKAIFILPKDSLSSCPPLWLKKVKKTASKSVISLNPTMILDSLINIKLQKMRAIIFFAFLFFLTLQNTNTSNSTNSTNSLTPQTLFTVSATQLGNQLITSELMDNLDLEYSGSSTYVIVNRYSRNVWGNNSKTNTTIYG